jgi:hypothetical protein
LDHGAAVNQLNEFGVSPIWCAAAANRPDVVRLLLAHGASPLVELPADGTSPLFVAARCGAAECVRLLAACPAFDVDRPRTGHFDVPLMAAVRHGHVDTVRELCRSGANVIVRCGNTLAAGDRAQARDSRILFELLATGRVPQHEVDRLLRNALYAMTRKSTRCVCCCAPAPPARRRCRSTLRPTSCSASLPPSSPSPILLRCLAKLRRRYAASA